LTLHNQKQKKKKEEDLGGKGERKTKKSNQFKE